MKIKSVILDNRNEEQSLAKFLRHALLDSEIFKIVSAYFTINGFKLLEDELKQIKRVNFLFGNRGSVGETDPSDQQLKSYKLTEEGLVANEILNQKQLAKRCADWIEKESVSIRSINESNFLHGKMYLSHSTDQDFAVVGSSNFTQSGLGVDTNSNIEINYSTSERSTCEELSGWFDNIWHDDSLTRNIKDEVLQELMSVGRNLSPEFVYYKTLYEIYKEEIDKRRESEKQIKDTNLFDTEIWKSLFLFQQHGALEVIQRLQRNNGCILADSVGLGKTYTALAVIKYFELIQDNSVLVLCPKKLSGNWTLYPAHYQRKSNPFSDDRFGYTVLSHTDLTRSSGEVGGINLKDFDWSKFSLVVIDESHNFRNFSNPVVGDDDSNERHSRYSFLLNEVIGSGVVTKVLMLSATPVNTSLLDLRNQIYLMTERRTNTFGESLGIDDLDMFMSRAQKNFKSWETSGINGKNRNKWELLEELGPEFIGLLGEVSIARSKRHVKKYYESDIHKIGDFPKKNPPQNRTPRIHQELSYEEVADVIDSFNLSIYTPLKFVNDERIAVRFEDKWGFKQQDREKFLIGMMKTNLLKRLESSVYSLRETLNRTKLKIEGILQKIDKYELLLNSSENIEIEFDYDEDDDDYVIVNKNYSLRYSELDLQCWRKEISKDLNVISTLLVRLEKITPARDGKLERLKKDIKKVMTESFKSKRTSNKRKILLFTTFKDTAIYLYDNLKTFADPLGIKMAMVSGDLVQTQFGENDFNDILDRFAPRGRKISDTAVEQIDLLIATDCISEGQNLQDCDTVVNFDIHWNPIRIIQRLGRIDRIGSKHEFVNMINYWPTEDMEVYLKLSHRVHARMALADAMASGDDDLLNQFKSEIPSQSEINFRDKQLKQMKDKVLDMDDLSENIVLSDFTMDSFISQLLNYLEQHRKELENTPKGVFAVTNKSDSENQSGVIFVLHQLNSDKRNIQKKASPIHPYYCVYIRYDGGIRYGCGQAKQVLELFEAIAVGSTSPLEDLCRQFDEETCNGYKMDRYEHLLKRVCKNICDKFQNAQIKGISSDASREFLIPKISETPHSLGDFELISWIVIR